ncbi:hypothetical protein BC937DRAFT_91151 [Endogone sp. FLAS-F59071]|nr:hypothetical protein BC937DRAFT_91151 [Endogone sp. FLAS-F59071]|eukprot:RUS16486.1 hypothetical protein BC937DRAFT_91151 [Endogone sp. FLAS-F59071]
MAESVNFSAGHALIIGTGTNEVGNKTNLFKSTINDAKWLADVLKDSSLCAYPEHQVKLLVGEDATYERILEELDALKLRVFNSDQQCNVVIFFSGHGKPAGDKSYLIPYGFRAGDQLTSRAIGGDLLYDKLRAIEGRVLLLLNACYSGSVMPKLAAGDGVDQEFPDPIMPLNQRHIDRLFNGTGFAYLCATQPSQNAITGYSAAATSKRYSAFTLGLAVGFSGRDKDGGHGTVYFSELVSACVAYVATKTKHKQRPYFDFRGDNFVVGFHKDGAARLYPLLGDDITFDADIDNDGEQPAPPVPSYHYTGATNTTFNNSSGPAFVGVTNLTGNIDFSHWGH